MTRVFEIPGIPERAQPHLACVPIDSAPTDDRLRRPEMCCVVVIMMRGVLSEMVDEFLINSVRQGGKGVLLLFLPLEHRLMLVNCLVKNLLCTRILQGHFDGSHIVIRTTQYLNFEEENEENLKLYHT